MKVDNAFLQAPLYPFLIALAPVVSLFVLNRLELGAFDMVRPAIVYLVVAIVAVAVSKTVSDSIRRAALLGCFLLLSFLTYGFAFGLAHSALEIEIQDHFFLLAWLFFTAAIYALLAVILRRSRVSLKDVTTVLNIFGIVVLAAALMPVILEDSAAPNDIEKAPPIHEWFQSRKTVQNSSELPDVYFIILDAYARGDILQSRFGYDNSDFVEWLELKGFFLGHQSHSNYAWTHLSLAATLNGEYLDTLVPNVVLAQTNQPVSVLTDDRLRHNSIKWMLVENFIKTSKVHRFFTSLGYRIISSNTGFIDTTQESTTLARALLGPMNPLEEALASQSLARPLIPLLRYLALAQELQITKYDRIVGALEDLASVADETGPKFVFSHLLSPHGPFSFDKEGEVIPQHPVYDASPWLSDKFAINGYADWYVENYPPNLEGLNHHLKETLQSIIDTTEGKAIVIIQSDHGPHAGYDLQSAANTDVEERFGILNAVYLPAEIPRDGLEQTMSSVNTFRVVLNNTFNLDLPLLEDRAFYSHGDLEFEEVTERLHDQAH